MESSVNLTELLNEAANGDPLAAERVARETYQALYDAARAQRVSWRGSPTLDTRAILHEAYLKLFANSGQHWDHRRHFYRAASRAMRHVLVDYARAQRTEKRRPEGGLVTLDDANPVAKEVAQDLLDLNDVLPTLEREHPDHAHLIEMRYFLGFTQAEVAEAMELSFSTVRRREAFALAFLRAEMGERGK